MVTRTLTSGTPEIIEAVDADATRYARHMPDDPEQLARDRARLAGLETRWSPPILDLSHDDAMRWYRTGKEIPFLFGRCPLNRGGPG